MNKKIQLIVIALILIAFSGCVQTGESEAGGTESEGIEQDADSTSDYLQDGESRGIVTDGSGAGTDSGDSRRDGPYLALWRIDPNCEDIDVKFDYSHIAVDEIISIGPVGGITDIIGGHVVPNDHSEINYGPEEVDIIMPADGYLTMAERHQYTPPPGAPKVNHYHLYFELSCSLYMGLVHISTIDPAVLEKSEELAELDEAEEMMQMKQFWGRIPIKAGEKIGTSTQWGTIGILIVDTKVPNTDYANPESYADSQPWRMYGVNAFDYFEEPLKSQMFGKVTRTAEPRGGKAGHDIVGKLIGCWFIEGTGGMGGRGTEGDVPPLCGNLVCSYWHGHFSIVPDVLEPEKIRMQFGYELAPGKVGPYAVKNGPDPTKISVEDGLVKYELSELINVPETLGYVEGDGTIDATVLIEMIDDMSVKIEPFAGKTADEVDGFTENAKVYVR